MELTKSTPITRYGGIIPIVREMIKRDLPGLIDSSLEEIIPRKHNSKYKFSDMLISWIVASFCGATRIEHITELKDQLKDIPQLSIPSHDTVGRLMKLLSDEVKIQERKMNYQVNENYYDDNLTLNRLLIQVTKQMGILNEKDEYILDVDCTFIETRCVGAMSMKDKDAPGFYPMICLIGELPVFVSMRNGNSIADFRIKECIDECLNLLNEANIKVKIVRSDGAGYRKELLTMIDSRNGHFIVGSPVNKSYKKMFQQLNSTYWKDTTIETANEFKRCQIGEIKYQMVEVEKPFRIIALRIPAEDKLIQGLEEEEAERRILVQKKMNTLKSKGVLKRNNKRYIEGDWNEVNDFKYKMFVTNDFDTPAEELVLLYNKRGDAERQFSFMKNDFGWKFPPFSRMNENTVFFIISAMANNVFRAIASIFNKNVDKLNLKSRIRKFQKMFIDVVAVCINGEWIFSSTKIDFEKIV